MKEQKQTTNYQLWLDHTLEEISRKEIRPSLLLQACCAPCSSYVLEYLNQYFQITVYFYNPNIASREEYLKRADELVRLMRETGADSTVKFILADYEPEKFQALAHGKEDLPEGGARCYDCYRLRLEATADYAKDQSFDYFSTTLSVSPHKNATWINKIGEEMAKKYGVDYLYADFKKRDGYRRSVQLSKDHDLYRQDYCGCEFSRIQALKRKSEAR